MAMGVDPGDEKYQRAVDVVARNCGGAGVRALLIGGHPRLDPKAVRVLAGTSPEYQRHVLGRALAGDPDPLEKTAESVLVYETSASARWSAGWSGRSANSGARPPT